jgi:hypothetical protein
MTISEVKAHEEKIGAQFHEVKALLEAVEAHAKKNKAQAEITKIDALKAKKEEIEKKFHQHLKTAGEAVIALKVKSEIEPELAKLRSSLEEVSTTQKNPAGTGRRS